MESKTLLQEWEEIKRDLPDDARLDRLELAVVTMAKILDANNERYDSALSRLEDALARVEKDGPAALLGSIMRPRRRERAGRNGE